MPYRLLPTLTVFGLQLITTNFPIIIVFFSFLPVLAKFSEEFVTWPGMEKLLSQQVLDNKTLHASTDTFCN